MLTKVILNPNTIDTIKRQIEEYEAEVKVKRASIINNEIAELYGIRLVCCPHCSGIESIPYENEGDVVCSRCCTVDEECHFSDLFY